MVDSNAPNGLAMRIESHSISSTSELPFLARSDWSKFQLRPHLDLDRKFTVGPSPPPPGQISRPGEVVPSVDMAKRSRAEREISDEPQKFGNSESTATSKSSKRAKKSPDTLPEALDFLLEHSEDLINNLECLRKAGKASAGTVRHLASLSRTLVTVFRCLRDSASEEVQEEQEQVDSGSSDRYGWPISTPKEPSTSSSEAVPKPRGPIPPLGSLTAWTTAEIPQTPPPLPEMLDARLEKAALTHSGMLSQQSDVSYENLEFLGDAFIYHVASEYISQTFPHLNPGRCSQLREQLLRNSNLSQYTLHYGLDKRAIFPEEFLKEGRDGGTKASVKERQKVLGDIFESYVGGLIRSDPGGVKRALDWLKPLWSMTLAKEIKEVYRVGSAAGGQEDLLPKVRLSRAIGCTGVKIRYEDVTSKVKMDKNGQPLFTVAVHVDAWGKSECLGSGSGVSKKDAGQKAALKALEDKKAMKFYQGKRKEYEASQQAQNAAGI